VLKVKIEELSRINISKRIKIRFLVKRILENHIIIKRAEELVTEGIK